ncbi:MAG: beta-propeller fold lactonase family protein, partial [Planctomycetota bacterium]|nr:beta-propeller fold lactonase family protein [Planctomycetota bacterium]
MNYRILVPILAACGLGSCPSAAAQGVPNFESPQARPVVVSADGQRLFAVNTPDHRLAIYSLAQPAAPVLIREIPVGYEPVSVALRSQVEAWVVNHVSDSISVVDVSRGVVLDTIQVGDEPGDVVFAGSPQRAFVSSMTNRSVQVIDPVTRQQVGSIPVFGDDPRGLLASADGKTVWVAITRSGNGTTIVPHTIAPAPPPPTNPALPRAPSQGILVLADDPAWKSQLNVSLPDHDVVELDTATMQVRRKYSGVGTILFQMAVRPGTDELWVANTHALNLVRFEPALRGHAIDSRVTRIAVGASPAITPVNLNPGIDYTRLPNPVAMATALSQPTDIAFDPSGSRAYVAAFGTDRIGVLDPAGKVVGRIEVGNTPGSAKAPRSKRGPRGLAHHPARSLLYVLNRLSNSLSVVDTAQAKVLREVEMFDPTPTVIREGRGFLYDAKLSGNGTMSCASCHIDGRHDGLAWDLGDPGGQMFSNGTSTRLHPMKGPLLTQTLQGLGGERMFHWRADRPGLATFNGTFASLMGGSMLGSADLGTFVAYMQQIRFMPNPNRNRDDTLPTTPPGTSAEDGRRIFRTKDKVGRNGANQFRCADCHLNASGTGSFGFDGLIGQPTKAAQLRGLYKRTGRQVRAAGRTAGFGFGADGSKDDLQAHMSSPARFNPLSATEKAALERFLLAFPTDMVPAVGFARTVTAANAAAPDVVRDLSLLVSQAESRKCDLVVRGFLDGRQAGLVYNTMSRVFDRDRRSLAAISLVGLAA